MKRFILPAMIIFSLFTSLGCVSKPIPIPGDSPRTIRNIYIEYMNIGNTFFKLEDYKSAAENYKLAMHNKKIYWACYYKLALCYVYTSSWANAESMYKQMLKRDPDNSSLKASLAYIYSMNGNVLKAIKMYASFLEEQPENESYLENYLVLILSEKKYFKKYRTAFEEKLEKLNEVNPENKNLTKITEKYKELAEIKEEEIEDISEEEELASEENESEGESELSDNDNPESSEEAQENTEKESSSEEISQ